MFLLTIPSLFSVLFVARDLVWTRYGCDDQGVVRKLFLPSCWWTCTVCCLRRRHLWISETRPFETSGMWTWVFVEVTLWSVIGIYSLFIQWRKTPTGNGTVKWWRRMVADNGREINCMRWWTRLTWGCIIWMWMRGVIHVIVIVRSGRRYHAFMCWECFIGCKSTGECGILLAMSTDTRRFNQPVEIWMRKRRSCCCDFRRRRV